MAYFGEWPGLSEAPAKGRSTHYKIKGGSGALPQQLKGSLYSAIFKAVKDQKHPKNYRPLSNLSKIVEKVIVIRLREELTEVEPISQEKLGFRAGHSTEHQLLRIKDAIRDKFGRKETRGQYS